MKAIESVVTVPALVSLVGGAQIVLRGRAGAEDVVVAGSDGGTAIGFNPMLGLAILGLLLISGSILVAREMHVEAREARKLREQG